MQDKDKYMTIKEAASFANKSTNTIRRAIKKGTLTARLIKGKYFILTSSVVSAYGLTQEMATQEVVTQEVATQEVVTQEVVTQSAPTHDVPTQKPPTQELLIQDHDQQLTHNAAYPLRYLIEVLKAELKSKDEQLRAKDEQLRAKDEQIAQLMHVLQSTMELIKQLPAPTEPVTTKPEPAPETEPETEPEIEPAPETETEPEPEGKGFWATVRKRFRR